MADIDQAAREALPEPYYEHGGITIYHGDCREILPGLEADAVVTDPPYGIGEARKDHGSRDRFAVRREYGKAAWDDAPPGEALMDLVRLAAPWSIVWGGNFHALPPSSCWLVWDKDNGACDFADCELAWTNLKGAVRKIKHRWAGMLQEPGAEREHRQHPTQKPLPVMKWAIQRLPKGCDVILDPFMGSGTTLRAAKDLGRKAIGIEIEEKYCEIAAKRLGQEVLDFG